VKRPSNPFSRTLGAKERDEDSLMVRRTMLFAAAVIAAASVHAQSPWRDASPHRAGFLVVDNARLHYLDWGGRGPLLLLVHGWNSNAHVFDDLAPRLTDRYHVVGLTLRGFGESDSAPSPYTLARYAEDVRATLDSLHAPRATIAAHSFGGWVLTEFAHRYPARVSSAVYLDAAFDMRGSDSIVARRPVHRPALAAKSQADVMRWLAADFYGMWTPALEAEYRSRPRDETTRDRQLERVGKEAERARPNWAELNVPALAVCALAIPASEFPWLSPSDSAYPVAARFVEQVRRPKQHAECEAFRRSRADHRVIELPGHHYVFIWHPVEVANAIRALEPTR
jgi:non-heme chloroperoxidase